MVEDNILEDNILYEQTAMFEESIPARSYGSLTSEHIPMPEGYYSGDQPNTHLRAFVEQHLAEHPYLPAEDDYAVTAFTTPIETTKATAIYNMHTYWSKKPHDAIREYIRHYTQPGDLIIDTFCGSGGTALAALMEGRKAIAIDRSPAATFITKNYCTPVDVQALKRAFEELKRKVQPELEWLYETRCDRCEGPATTAYTVYSQVFQCPRCLKKVPLFDCVLRDAQTMASKSKKINVCPFCYKLGIEEEINTRSKKFGAVPVLVSYLCKGKCKGKRKHARGVRQHNDEDVKKREYFQKYDLGRIKEIEEKEIPHWYPQGYDMRNFSRYQRDALYYYGVKEVADLFTKRNLWALAAVRHGIETISGIIRDALLFTLTSIILKSSRMMAHNSDGIGRIQKGTYYIPQLLHDINVWQFMEEAVGDMIAGYHAIGDIGNKLIIGTSDARQLDMPNSSIDYIFTDPPYADKVQYGELNFVWETWLGFDIGWHEQEIIVNAFRNKTETDWASGMRRVLAECHRILKPGRCISLCYHDTSEGTWSLLQDLMAEVGFVPEITDKVLYVDSKTKTTNQYFADKVTKRDLIINFRKPRHGETSSVTIIGDEDEATFTEKVHTIMRDYLLVHPGITKDRIYDEVVSRMVRSGQMEEHDFDALLQQIAEPHGDNAMSWFLLPGDEVHIDEAESAREDTAADIISEFISTTLNGRDEEEGIHYSNIFECFLYSVHEKPRRKLAEWLPDYFYTTENGDYRLPGSEEERAVKAQARQSGTSRRIKRFLAYLEHGLEIPADERPSSAIIADWLHQCCITHQYQQGLLLYERGGLDLDQLSGEQLIAVEEDYLLCSMHGARNALQQQKQVQEQEKKKQRRRKVQTGPTLFDEDTTEQPLSDETA